MTGKSQLDRFVKKEPLAVMTRAVVNGLLDAEAIDELFEANRITQYEEEIPFHCVVAAMAEITLGTSKNRSQAYDQVKDLFDASKTAFYRKINRTDPPIAEALVKHSAEKSKRMLDEMNFSQWMIIAGYDCYSIDGNHIQCTQRRLKEARNHATRPIPGTIVAKFHHNTALFTNGFALECGHAQEALTLDAIIQDMSRGDLYFADRHFCIKSFFLRTDQCGACFVVRQKSSLKGELLGKRKKIGSTNTGVVYEQAIRVCGAEGECTFRRITVELFEPTRDGDTVIHLISNVPAGSARATDLADGYLHRWEIENAFHVLTLTLNCESETNSYPRCAILQFCVAMVAFNARRLLFGALYGVHKEEDVDAMSEQKVALASVRVLPGLLIAIDNNEWNRNVPNFGEELARFLQETARHVNPRAYKKSIRGAKKPRPDLIRSKSGTHLSAAKLIRSRKHANI